jgi:uncharacterized protein
LLLWRAAFRASAARLSFVPLASTAIGPRAAAPLLPIIGGAAAAGVIPGVWRHADQRDVGTMSVGALAGTPLGAWVLSKSDPLLIRWAIVLFATMLLALWWSGWRYHGKPTIPLTGAAAAEHSCANRRAPDCRYRLGRPISPETLRANIVPALQSRRSFSTQSILPAVC